VRAALDAVPQLPPVLEAESRVGHKAHQLNESKSAFERGPARDFSQRQGRRRRYRAGLEAPLARAATAHRSRGLTAQYEVVSHELIFKRADG